MRSSVERHPLARVLEGRPDDVLHARVLRRLRHGRGLGQLLLGREVVPEEGDAEGAVGAVEGALEARPRRRRSPPRPRPRASRAPSPSRSSTSRVIARAAKSPPGSARIARTRPPPCAPSPPTTAIVFLATVTPPPSRTTVLSLGALRPGPPLSLFDLRLPIVTDGRDLGNHGASPAGRRRVSIPDARSPPLERGRVGRSRHGGPRGRRSRPPRAGNASAQSHGGRPIRRPVPQRVPDGRGRSPSRRAREVRPAVLPLGRP